MRIHLTLKASFPRPSVLPQSYHEFTKSIQQNTDRITDFHEWVFNWIRVSEYSPGDRNPCVDRLGPAYPYRAEDANTLYWWNKYEEEDLYLA